MANSELAKAITRLVKATDKFVQDLTKDAVKTKEAAEELKRILEHKQ